MKTITAFLLGSIVSLASCQKEPMSPSSLNIDISNAKKGGGGGTNTLVLGQQYGGGYICYLDETNQHGLIISTVNVPGGPFKWSNGDLTTAIGAFDVDGLINTKKIIQAYGKVGKNVTPYAALAAKNYTEGGFNDWYLPTYVEWEKINATRNMSVNLNISNDVNYLTSSEDPLNYIGIQVLLFTSAGYGGNGGFVGTGKDALFPIRTIRKF